MGRVVAIGGGTYEEIDAIASEIVKLSKKDIPNVLFIGTALKDSTNPLTSCKKTFKRVCPGCIVKKLSILRKEYTDQEMDDLLEWADIIFVGGGDTAFMIETWKEKGLFEKLKKVYEEDSAVLSGVSAGAICWFEKGYTDSAAFRGEEDWDYEWITPGFSFNENAFCPHFNDWSRNGYGEALEQIQSSGYGVDDRAALVLNGDQVYCVQGSEEAHIYFFEYSDKGMKKEKIL